MMHIVFHMVDHTGFRFDTCGDFSETLRVGPIIPCGILFVCQHEAKCTTELLGKKLKTGRRPRHADNFYSRYVNAFRKDINGDKLQDLPAPKLAHQLTAD